MRLRRGDDAEGLEHMQFCWPEGPCAPGDTGDSAPPYALAPAPPGTAAAGPFARRAPSPDPWLARLARLAPGAPAAARTRAISAFSALAAS